MQVFYRQILKNSYFVATFISFLVNALIYANWNDGSNGWNGLSDLSDDALPCVLWRVFVL